MRLVFIAESWEDYLYWQKTDKKLHKRINLLIKEILRHPYEGIGKPEPLKHFLTGCWSRRINSEHRFIYQIKDDAIIVVKCRFHYD